MLQRIEGVIPWLAKELTKEEITILKKELIKIINKGGDFMSNFEKAFKKIIEEEAKTREKRGTIKIIKGFLAQKVDDEIILKATGISKKELEELKLQMV